MRFSFLQEIFNAQIVGLIALLAFIRATPDILSPYLFSPDSYLWLSLSAENSTKILPQLINTLTQHTTLTAYNSAFSIAPILGTISAITIYFTCRHLKINTLPSIIATIAGITTQIYASNLMFGNTDTQALTATIIPLYLLGLGPNKKDALYGILATILTYLHWNGWILLTAIWITIRYKNKPHIIIPLIITGAIYSRKTITNWITFYTNTELYPRFSQISELQPNNITSYIILTAPLFYLAFWKIQQHKKTTQNYTIWAITFTAIGLLTARFSYISIPALTILAAHTLQKTTKTQQYTILTCILLFATLTTHTNWQPASNYQLQQAALWTTQNNPNNPIINYWDEGYPLHQHSKIKTLWDNSQPDHYIDKALQKNLTLLPPNFTLITTPHGTQNMPTNSYYTYIHNNIQPCHQILNTHIYIFTNHKLNCPTKTTTEQQKPTQQTNNTTK